MRKSTSANRRDCDDHHAPSIGKSGTAIVSARLAHGAGDVAVRRVLAIITDASLPVRTAERPRDDRGPRQRPARSLSAAATKAGYVWGQSKSQGASGLGDIVRRIETGYCDQTPGGGRRWIVHYPETVSWRDETLARRPGGDGEPNVKTLIELPTFAILAPSHGPTHPTSRP